MSKPLVSPFETTNDNLPSIEGPLTLELYYANDYVTSLYRPKAVQQNNGLYTVKIDHIYLDGFVITDAHPAAHICGVGIRGCAEPCGSTIYANDVKEENLTEAINAAFVHHLVERGVDWCNMNLPARIWKGGEIQEDSGIATLARQLAPEAFERALRLKQSNDSIRQHYKF